MKRLVIILSIIAIMATVSPVLPALANPTQIPHEKPTTATDFFNKAGLLLSYNTIVNLASSRQYQDSQALLSELAYANIPDELRYIADRYSHLYRQLFTTLENLEALLDETSTLLAHRQTYEAKQRLDGARTDILDASSLLEDLDIATNTLSNQLGVTSSSAASRLRQAHTRLRESMKRLQELVDELNRLWQSLVERYAIITGGDTQTTGLMPTKLTLNITPVSAFVGDSITLSGRLSGDGKPMARKELVFTLDNEPVASTFTSACDGSYAASIIIPYRYVKNMTVAARYKPAGDDIDKYLASQSPPVTVNIMFYQTRLESSAPEIIYPGRPLSISGQVSSSNGNTDRTLNIFLDDTRLAEATVSGRFRLELTTPEQAPTGQHSLTVAVTPQGRYAGAAEARSIDISKLPIYMDAQMPPPIILSPTIRISGRIYDDFGPVADARINLKLKNLSSTAMTSADGSFASTINLPVLPESAPLSSNPFYFHTPAGGSSFDLSLVSAREIAIAAASPAPWHKPLRMKKRVFVVNPLTTGLMLVLLMSLGLLVYMRSKVRAPEAKAIPGAEVIELPAMTAVPVPKPRFTGFKGRILSAYYSGLEVVEKITGIDMAPNITLREFLKMTTLLAPTNTGPFAELTFLTETTLYANYNPNEEAATKAEQLATDIKKELHRGTS